MEIPNYDRHDKNTNFKRLYGYMPSDTFRMLICGNSGSGKTNLLYHMLMKPLLYYDRIHLYAKNLEQQKYKDMLQTLTDISNSVGYNVLVCSNDDIIPVEELKDEDAQKIVIFDDFICEKKPETID